MTVAVRFAPSPTGLLHLGNARIAVVNARFAQANGGTLLLRLDDTDTERSTAEFAAAIEEDLAWLGIGWDCFARQSDRMDRYDAAIARLKAVGRLYPCWETAEELALKRRLQRARGLPPVYDRAALRLKPDERPDRAPHWRFLLDGETVTWADAIKGETRVPTASLSDPVLVREDGRPLYTLSSVVDDAELGISHVIRGEDHVTNTAVQVQLFQALGASVPVFAHLSLLVGPDGQGLSKRTGALSLRSLRAEGIEPQAIVSVLSRLGTSGAEGFALEHFGRSAARFDPADLAHESARVVHDMPFATAQARLPWLTPAFWDAVRQNLHRLGEAEDWRRIAEGEVPPSEPDPLAAGLLPPEPWDETTWGAWTAAVKQATGRTGKALFLPLRRALTGLDHGPEMRLFLPLIGRTRAVERLTAGGQAEAKT
ncbi:glutamate--tRNA ligase [Zavarzinia sp. CC-PAN008]|uniref:glutamate--tRNA ligase n=1 Tax=Zavarzinia sp. CC-PAN008 TaxID=3243332 RepID=UPI003F749674